MRVHHFIAPWLVLLMVLVASPVSAQQADDPPAGDSDAAADDSESEDESSPGDDDDLFDDGDDPAADDDVASDDTAGSEAGADPAEGAEVGETPPADDTVDEGSAGSAVLAEIVITKEATAAFEVAWTAMEERRYAEASSYFASFIEHHPLDPRVATATKLKELADHYVAEPVGPVGVAGELGEEDSDSAAGIELVSFATIYGIWTGVSSSFFLDLDSTSFLLVSGIGGLVGLGGSIWYAWDRDVRSAEVSLVENGALIGAWNGIAALSAANAFNDDAEVFGVTWLASALGLAAGATFAAVFPEIDDGDVALANSGALWGTFVAGMFMLMIEVESSEDLFLGLLLGTDLGLAGMSVAAIWLDSSRGRQVIIDLGGLLAGLLGGGILAAAGPDSPQTVSIVMLLSVGSGLALTAWLTSGMSDDDDEADGSTLKLHTPTPLVLPTRAGSDDLAYGASLINLTY